MEKPPVCSCSDAEPAEILFKRVDTLSQMGLQDPDAMGTGRVI